MHLPFCALKFHVCSLTISGEPSAPKLEGQMGEDGNSIKVNLIKQDDGGSPIRHYLVKYRAVSGLLPRPHVRLCHPDTCVGRATAFKSVGQVGDSGTLARILKSQD